MSPDTCPSSVFLNPRIGYLVPILSFGGTFAGILLTGLGLQFNIQFAAIGAVFGSILLAYLAFLRPRKDIVSLSTPIYAVVFFAYPIEYYTGVIIQLMYAAGLAVLVVRLNRRFGVEDIPVLKNSLSAPLQAYVDRVRERFPDRPGFVADGAGEAFAHFARGEYREAADMADLGLKDLDGAPDGNPIIRAFSIVSEQARHMEHTLELPGAYLKFLPGQEEYLAHSDPAADPGKEYYRTLYNALLVLYALAWSADPDACTHILKYRDFAEKLFAE